MAKDGCGKNFYRSQSDNRPITREDRRLPDTPVPYGLFRKSALPSSDIGLKARRLETKRRDVIHQLNTILIN